MEQGELNKAKAYREKLPALKPHDAWLVNNIAWTLATSANPASRDGSNAIVFAEQAVAATKRKEPGYLDTLAAAYAESGQFTNAVSVQKDAIDLLTEKKAEKKVIDDYTTRLRLYETNAPYRKP